MTDFSAQMIPAFVEAVSVLYDSIVCCRLEIGTWLSDLTSTASAPSTVVCLTERLVKEIKDLFQSIVMF